MNIEYLNLLKSPQERRKIKGMNQFRLQYIYTWKCHNETPCTSFFSKTENRKVKQVLSEGLVTVRGEDIRKG
jgi:hypothetical protein